LLYNTLYYARVKTNNNPNWGPVTSFRTKLEVFSRLIAPVHASTNVDFEVLRATAQAITQAKRYTIEVSTNSSFTGTNIVYTSLSDGQTSFVLRNLDPSMTYYTRIKTDVNKTWGPTTSFTTRASTGYTRIWGITGGDENAGGSIFSFSLDSMKFTEHKQLGAAEGFGKDIVLGPEGLYAAQFTSPYEADYRASIFRYTPETGATDQSVAFANSMELRLAMGSNENLYAAINSWGTAGKLARISPDLNSYKDFYFYKDATGRNPTAGVVEVDGWLYGTTHVGGQFDFGTVYKVRPDGSNYQVLYNFSSQGLYFPNGLVYGNDGFLYGTAVDGKDNVSGGVFQLKLDGTVYVVLHLFYDGTSPHFPEGDPIVKNGVVYGVCKWGGPGFVGTVFRINTNGTGYRDLLNFGSFPGYALGGEPNGDLVLHRDGYLYGTTPYGGAHGKGVLYRVRSDGTGAQKLFDFSDETGPYPYSGVVVMDDPFAPSSALIATAARLNVQVYPNPTTDAFLITSEEGSLDTRIELTDLSGNRIHSSIISREGIELGRELPRGIYVLKVIEGETVTMHRLVKK
jgi:uncharacterized repeat protein (TIGR03803 family)